MTKAAMLEEMARAKGVLLSNHFKKHVFNRTAFNRMGNNEQVEYEKKLQIRMPFAVQLPDGGFFEITKTEAEHFLALMDR